MWYAIVVDDPAKLKLATGDEYEQDGLYSVGTNIADAKTLAARGLVAVEHGDEPIDFAIHAWDKVKRVFVPAETDEERLAREIEELAERLDTKLEEQAAMQVAKAIRA